MTRHCVSLTHTDCRECPPARRHHARRHSHTPRPPHAARRRRAAASVRAHWWAAVRGRLRTAHERMLSREAHAPGVVRCAIEPEFGTTHPRVRSFERLPGLRVGLARAGNLCARGTSGVRVQLRPRRRSWVVHGACWRVEWRWALGVPHVAATGATRAATRKAGAVAQRGGRSRLRLFSSRRTVHVDELKMARGVVVPRALRRGANRGSGTGSSGELGAVRGARSLTGVESCWRRSSMAHDSIHRRRSALALEIWPLRGHGIILSRFGGRRGRTARSRWHDAATRVAARGGLGRREARIRIESP